MATATPKIFGGSAVESEFVLCLSDDHGRDIREELIKGAGRREGTNEQGPTYVQLACMIPGFVKVGILLYVVHPNISDVVKMTGLPRNAFRQDGTRNGRKQLANSYCFNEITSLRGMLDYLKSEAPEAKELLRALQITDLNCLPSEVDEDFAALEQQWLGIVLECGITPQPNSQMATITATDAAAATAEAATAESSESPPKRRRTGSSFDDVVQKLNNAQSMHAAGLITEENFKRLVASYNQEMAESFA